MPKIGARPFQRKDGRWCAKYDKGIDGASGKRKCGYVYGNSATDVKEKLKKIGSSMANDTFIDRNSLILKKWMNDWLNDYKKHSLKISTYKSYEFVANKYINPALGRIRIQQLKPGHEIGLISLIKNVEILLGDAFHITEEELPPAFIPEVHSLAEAEAQ
jgi:hypothetical protein